MVIEPVTVEIEPEQKTNNDVEQRVYVVAKQDKYRLYKIFYVKSQLIKS